MTEAQAQGAGFTPGPWTVTLTGRRGSFYIKEAHEHEAAKSDDGVDGYTVSSANARLIAASPALYEALDKVARGPVQPAPDPGAHSWEAYARFWRSECIKLQNIARAALRAASPESGGA